jgi:ABC-type oligopeptide transport system substrate-binding subunit
MFLTGGEQNQTGWGNEAYDELVKKAQREPDLKQRADYFHQAETILMGELPILPLYYYTASELVRPNVRGFYANLQDMHPISAMWIDPTAPRNASQQGKGR